MIRLQRHTQKLKINGRSSRENVLETRRVSTGDFGIYTPSISLIASEQTVIAAEWALRTLPGTGTFSSDVSVAFFTPGGQSLARGRPAAVRSSSSGNNNKNNNNHDSKRRKKIAPAKAPDGRSHVPHVPHPVLCAASSRRALLSITVHVCDERTTCEQQHKNTMRLLTLNHCRRLCSSLREPKSEHVGTPTRSFHLSGRRDDKC